MTHLLPSLMWNNQLLCLNSVQVQMEASIITLTESFKALRSATTSASARIPKAFLPSPLNLCRFQLRYQQSITTCIVSADTHSLLKSSIVPGSESIFFAWQLEGFLKNRTKIELIGVGRGDIVNLEILRRGDDWQDANGGNCPPVASSKRHKISLKNGIFKLPLFEIERF